MSKQERRTTTTECRQTTDGVITGVAAVFDSLSLDLGGWKEKIAPGAFSRVLKTPGLDVMCLFNHNANKVLGRTTAGTLKLWESDEGLEFECKLGNTSWSQDVREAIKRGDITQCSFGFVVGEQEWTKESGEEIRIVREVSQLLDVSPVTYPAYQETSCDARAYFPDGMPKEVRQRYNGEIVNGVYRVAWSDEDFTEWANLRLKLAGFLLEND